MVLYCSAYWDLQLKLKNNDKKKKKFVSQQAFGVLWYYSVWCLRLFSAFTVCELHLRDAVILKFVLLFKLVFGMWRRFI